MSDGVSDGISDGVRDGIRDGISDGVRVWGWVTHLDPPRAPTQALPCLLQVAAGIIAAYYISEAMVKHGHILASYKEDAEVAAFEARQAKIDAVLASRTRLGDLPCLPRLLLLAAVGLITVSSYALAFLSKYCFEEFDLATGDFHEVMCLSCEKRIVKGPGWAMLGMLGIGLLCNVAFGRWAASQDGASSGDPA